MSGKLINLFLMDGNPNGRIKCSLTNWTGVAYKIPRTMLDKARSIDALKQTGVYLLFGADPKTECVKLNQIEMEKGEAMKLLIHDLKEGLDLALQEQFDRVIQADGKYGHCLGCFQCWTKSPASCKIHDSLREISCVLGQADDLTIVSQNCYGTFSAPVKNILDRAIGTSTPLSTYRGGLMHHCLRFGEHKQMTVWVYGEISLKEKETWRLVTERNALNEGFRNYQVSFFASSKDLEAKLT